MTRSLDVNVREGVFHVPDLPLKRGGRLGVAVLAWALVGPDDAPVVLALGGISAGRDARAWWPGVVGDAPLDLQQVRVLAVDWLGGPGGSSGPCAPGVRAGAGQPPCFDAVALDPADQADALAALVDDLLPLGAAGEPPLAAAVGASLGGCVVLHLVARRPDLVGRAAVLCAAHRPWPAATAVRSAQRRILRLAAHGADPDEAVAAARALGMISYRSPVEFAQRFDGPVGVGRDGEPVAPVDGWLDARGAEFAARIDPRRYACVSAQLDYHDVDPALLTCVPLHVFGVRGDAVVPESLLEEMVARIRGAGGDVRLELVDSPYGHDGFLKETAAVKGFLGRALDRVPGLGEGGAP